MNHSGSRRGITVDGQSVRQVYCRHTCLQLVNKKNRFEVVLNIILKLRQLYLLAEFLGLLFLINNLCSVITSFAHPITLERTDDQGQTSNN